MYEVYTFLSIPHLSSRLYKLPRVETPEAAETKVEAHQVKIEGVNKEHHPLVETSDAGSEVHFLHG